MKLNTENWESFKIDDLFIFERGIYSKTPEGIIPHRKAGYIPFVSATSQNNGVSGWVKEDEVQLMRANGLVVTTNGSICYGFYQDAPFTGSQDIKVLYHKDGHKMTSNEGMFIATVISLERFRFSYGRKCMDKKVFGNITIKLPVKDEDNHQPDWGWIENYMNSLPRPSKTPKIGKLSNKRRPDLVLKTDEWGQFAIKDLFSVIRGQYTQLPEDAIDKRQDGYIPFISSTSNNNGVSAYVKDTKHLEPYGLAVTVNGSLCYGFYQSEPFTGSQNIKVIYHKDGHKMTSNEGMFVASVISLERFRFSYGRKCKDTKVFENIIIKLPIKHSIDSEMADKIVAQAKADPTEESIYGCIMDEVIYINRKDWRTFWLLDLFDIVQTENGKEEAGGVITIDSDDMGRALYEPNNFTGADNIIKLVPRFDMTENVGMLATVMLNRARSRYMYGKRRGIEALEAEIIKMPIVKDEKPEPDWDWIERYMTSLISEE